MYYVSLNFEKIKRFALNFREFDMLKYYIILVFKFKLNNKIRYSFIIINNLVIYYFHL